MLLFLLPISNFSYQDEGAICKITKGKRKF
jgi:hypothetical protein